MAKATQPYHRHSSLPSKALFLLCAAALCQHAARAEAAHVGPDVRTRLIRQPTARVMILLDLPGPAAPTMEAHAARVSRAQETVLASLRDEDGAALRRRFRAVAALALDVDARALRRLESHPLVGRIDLDEGGSGNLAQSVPLTGASSVQALGYTGAGVTVAFLDSGLDRDHPDLADSLVAEACFCSGISGTTGCCPNGLDTMFGPGSAEDDNGHGSNVAGIITSNGDVAPVGVAPGASLVAVKVLDASSSFCCSSDVVAGLDWILFNRPDVDVVNMSLGTSALFAGDCDATTAYTQAFSVAIGNLRASGVTSFAASGNNRSATAMNAPACVAGAVSVGAVWDSSMPSQTYFGCTDTAITADKITCFSNGNASTDLVAPGARITSDSRSGGQSTYVGTSQAVAHASACAASLLQADPSLLPDEIEQALESTGPLLRDPRNGLDFPRVDCLDALGALPEPAGHLPEDGLGPAGFPLDVTPAPGGQVLLTWGDSCVAGDIDYAVYEGTLGAWSSHAPLLCSTGGLTQSTIAPSAGSTYFLVVPRNAAREGSYGARSDGTERPAGVPACLPQKVAAACQ